MKKIKLIESFVAEKLDAVIVSRIQAGESNWTGRPAVDPNQQTSRVMDSMNDELGVIMHEPMSASDQGGINETLL